MRLRLLLTFLLLTPLAVADVIEVHPTHMSLTSDNQPTITVRHTNTSNQTLHVDGTDMTGQLIATNNLTILQLTENLSDGWHTIYFETPHFNYLWTFTVDTTSPEILWETADRRGLTVDFEVAYNEPNIRWTTLYVKHADSPRYYPMPLPWCGSGVNVKCGASVTFDEVGSIDYYFELVDVAMHVTSQPVDSIVLPDTYTYQFVPGWNLISFYLV